MVSLSYEEFLAKLRDADLLAAIRQAETESSGEIRVVICREPTSQPERVAWQRFHSLRMDRTALRNGALIFVAPATRNFAIIGDSGIHAACGALFWQEAAQALSAGFAHGDITEALVQTIQALSRVLAQHFPRSTQDVNELNNQIVRDA